MTATTANRYGVHNLAYNSGLMSTGVGFDTPALPANGIRSVVADVGRGHNHAAMTRLLIAAGGAGSNGSRLRLWKHEPRKLAVPARHCHTNASPRFPPPEAYQTPAHATRRPCREVSDNP
jgi:hypothetical protein